MKNILISSKIIKDRYNITGSFIENNWKKFFEKKKINLINTYGMSDLEKNLSYFKPIGIIFSGGNDINKVKKNKINYERDLHERKLLSFALKTKIPILGVCRGFQFIVSELGGQLKKKPNHVRTRHKLKINSQIFSQNIKELIINSYHNICVVKLNEFFTCFYLNKDKTIEFALSKDKKIMCMMFHPERKNKSEILVKKIIFDFFKL